MKQKHIKINKVLHIDIYGYILHLNISNNIIKQRNKFSKELCGKLSKDETIDGLHSYHNDRPMKSFIFLSENVSSGTIAHEAFHATLRIMKMVSNKLSRSSEESFAYLLGYIVDEIHKLFEEYEKI